MKVKVGTIDLLSLDAPNRVKRAFKARADEIVEDGAYVDLSGLKKGERKRVIGINKERNWMYLNFYQRV